MPVPPTKQSRERNEFCLGVWASHDELLARFVQTMGGRFNTGVAKTSWFRVPNVNARLGVLTDGGETFQVFACGEATFRLLKTPSTFKKFDAVVYFTRAQDPKDLLNFVGRLRGVWEARRQFVPVVVLAVHEGVAPAVTFYHLIKLKEELEKATGIPAYIGEIRGDEGETVLARKLKVLSKELQKGMGNSRNVPLLVVEKAAQRVASKLEEAFSKNPDEGDLLTSMLRLEASVGRPLTRPRLVRWWGHSNEYARDVLDAWERLLDQDARFFTQRKARSDPRVAERAEKLLAGVDLGSWESSFTNLSGLGLSHSEVELLVAHLLDAGVIAKPTFHNPTPDYLDYTNLVEFVVVLDGVTAFTRRIGSSSVEKAALFSGMVQAIEMVRDRFLSETRESFQPGRVELLQFGPLKALIGRADRLKLKVIVRLLRTPTKSTCERMERFLDVLEGLAGGLSLSDPASLEKFLNEKFDQVFNPFPLKVNWFDRVLVNPGIGLESDLRSFTRLEQRILRHVHSLQPVSVRRLVRQSKRLGLAETDLVATLLDLVVEGTLVRQPAAPVHR
ncbi:MAG: hypothetical protein Kow0069_14020 [Promethearchaeota archaeon]